MGPDDIRVLMVYERRCCCRRHFSLFRLAAHNLAGEGWVSDFESARRHARVRARSYLSMKSCGRSVALIALIMLLPKLHCFNILGASITPWFSVCTVSSRLTGEIFLVEPDLGFTVGTLLLTSLIFLIVGWTGPAITYALSRRSVCLPLPLGNYVAGS